ncbi:hypothetical protein DER45DRAFT_610697 [Fusarium avenaceum]|nr:hypothetical protein DER45DRAFT_610697 [Fusarium avenaceum]
MDRGVMSLDVPRLAKKRGATVDSNDIEETTENLSHFKILPAIIETEIRQHIEQNSGPSNDSIISFNFAFALVEPGVEAMSHVNGHERLYTLTSGRYSNLQDEKMAYLRNVRYIDTDGNVKSISELESVPICPQANSDEVRQQLVKRGKLFDHFKGVHHKSYSGVYTPSDAASGATQHSTSLNTIRRCSRQPIDFQPFTRLRVTNPSHHAYTISPWNIRAGSIWKIFAGILSEFELEQLAHDKFNGRQIMKISKPVTAMEYVNPS